MKAITENLAIATIIALALGIYRTTTYYSVFRVDILPYLETSEIFQLQFLYLFVIGMIVFSVGVILLTVYLGEGFEFDKKYMEFVSQDKKIKIGTHFVIAYSIGIFGLMFLFGFRSSASNARQIIAGEHENEVTVVFENDYIVTDSVNIFAGKTKNYIFFYNKNKKQTRVFKMDDVKEVRYMRGLDIRKDKRGFWAKLFI